MKEKAARLSRFFDRDALVHRRFLNRSVALRDKSDKELDVYPVLYYSVANSLLERMPCDWTSARNPY